MRKILAMAAALMSLIGCSNDNQITLVNEAQESIMFNFRASETDVPAGASGTIKDIPNGTFVYSTTYTLPPGATSWSVSGNAGGGSLTFEKKQTKQRLIYSSTLVNGAYTLYVNSTSTDPIGAVTITGPR